jgi:serine/threonine-protein kinase
LRHDWFSKRGQNKVKSLLRSYLRVRRPEGDGLSGRRDPVNAYVKEANVMTAGYLPAYGRTQGGVFDLVSKSGSNAFHLEGPPLPRQPFAEHVMSMVDDFVFAGQYRIKSRLGQGGMGVVFLAEHLATGLSVALKVLWPHLLGSKAANEGFRREAYVATSLPNEHFVKVLDAGVDRAFGLPYLVMERLHGRTLDEVVLSSGPLSVGELLTIMGQLGSALDQAHGHVGRDGRPAPIVHRDLKPENVMITEAGAVKLLDFGIAKVLSANHARTGELRGTPLFMAPEQIDDGPPTPRIDVWALGLIAFFLLTGRPYWLSAARPSGSAPALVFEEVLSLPIVSPRWRAHELGLRPTWPSSFDTWFLGCVNRTPALRFASAGEAVAELHEAFGVSPRRDACRLLARLSNALPGLCTLIARGVRDTCPSPT